MNSKLTNITYKEGDLIKITSEILESSNFFQEKEKIDEEIEDENIRKVAYNDLLNRIKANAVINHIKTHSKLQIDDQEYNAILSNITYGNESIYSTEEMDKFKSEAYEELYTLVIYETFKQQFNVKIDKNEVEDCLKKINSHLSEDELKYVFTMNEQALYLNKALEFSKIEAEFEKFFKIDLNTKNMGD